MDYFCGENTGKFVFCLMVTEKRRMRYRLHSPENEFIHIMTYLKPLVDNEHEIHHLPSYCMEQIQIVHKIE